MGTGTRTTTGTGTGTGTGRRTGKGGELGSKENHDKHDRRRERAGDAYGQQTTSVTRRDARASTSHNKSNQIPLARRQEQKQG